MTENRSEIGLILKELAVYLDQGNTLVAGLDYASRLAITPKVSNAFSEMASTWKKKQDLMSPMRAANTLFTAATVELTELGLMTGMLPIVWRKASDISLRPFALPSFTEVEKEKRRQQFLWFSGFLDLYSSGLNIESTVGILLKEFSNELAEKILSNHRKNTFLTSGLEAEVDSSISKAFQTNLDPYECLDPLSQALDGIRIELNS